MAFAVIATLLFYRGSIVAQRFILTAQLQLAAPNNVRQIVSQINRGLQGITANVNINVRGVTQQLRTVQTGLRNVSRAATVATNDMERFGEQSARAIRRFGAFTFATATFIKLTNAIGAGIDEAIKYDREMVRLSQVTGQTLGNLKGLSDEVTRLSKEFGVSSSEVLGVSVTLAQAGLNAKDTQKALEAIAKTAVSSTFGDIKNTTEAAIAVMQQFGKKAGDLEGILGSINAVSARYAVESEDIAVAVRRAGGAFQAAGGQLEEFEALFTSVRQTTRESAETIATGFRTIFTRLQRGRTQDFLKSMGIDLQDAEQQFVGPYEAIRRISTALKDIRTTDPRFSQIIEELGGFRQISKVIPLLTKFDVAQEALNVAIRGGDSLSKDAAVSQQALSIQIAKVKEEFLALIRTFTDSSSFRGVIELTLKMTSALIKLFDALQPVLPLMAAFAAVRIGSNIGSFTTGFKRGFTRFASGGQVGGSGNGDTVPAMLTPGEFVITKKAAKAIGISTLTKLNTGTVKGYAAGGSVGRIAAAAGSAMTNPLIALAIVGSLQGLSQQFVKADSVIGQFVDGIGQTAVQFALLLTTIKGLSSSLPNMFKNIGFGKNFRQAAADTRSESQLFRDRFNDSIRGGATPDAARNAARGAISNRRYVRNSVNAINIGGAALGAGGVVAGGFLSNAGNAQIKAGTGGVGQVATGGLLSGAGIGAGVGSVFGPVGTFVGAIAGGAIGYVTALEDATQRLKAVKFEQNLDKLSKRIERFSKGELTTSDIGNDVVKAITDTLKTSSGLDGDARQNLEARFNQDASGIEKYFNQVAANSSTMDEFNKVTKDTLVQFSVLSKVPFSELQKQIKNVIDANVKQKAAIQQLTAFQSAQAKQIIVLNAFSQAIASVSEKFKTFDQTMSNINSNVNGGSSSFLARDTSSVFSAAREGKGDINLVTQFAGELGNIFGGAGRELAGSAIQDSKILSELPTILERVQSQSPLEETGTDFADRLRTELQKTFSDASATSSIEKLVNKLELIQKGAGDDQRTSRTDPFDLAAQLGTSIGEAIKIFEEMAPQFQQQAERIKNAFGTYEQAILRGASLGTEINDKEQERLDLANKAREIPTSVSGAIRAQNERTASISGGAISVDDLKRQLQDSQASANSYGELASNAIDPTELEKYAKQQANANISAQRAAQALRAVADSSFALNTVQEKLAIAEQKRNAKLNYVNVLAFGSPAEKAQLAKDQVNTAKAFKNGLGSVPEADRSGILNLLQSMPKENELFGTTAGEVLRKLQEDAIGGSLADLGLLPGTTKEEQGLATQQDKIIQEQIDALNALRDNALGFGTDAASKIAEQNKAFLAELKKIFTERQISEIDSQIETLRNNITKSETAADAAVSLDKRGFNALDTKGSILGITASLSNIANLVDQNAELTNLGKTALNGFTVNPNSKGQDRAAEVTAQARIAYQRAGLNPDDVSNLRINSNTEGFGSLDNTKKIIQRGIDAGLAKKQKELRANIDSAVTEVRSTASGNEAFSAAGNTTDSFRKYVKDTNNLVNAADVGDGNLRQAYDRSNRNASDARKQIDVLDKRKKILQAPPVPPTPKTPPGTPTSSTGNGVGQNIASTMNNTVNAFSTVLNGFSSVIQSLPSELTLQANHKVEVIINGAEMFANLQPEIQAMVVNQTKTAINNMIDTKFPDVGRMA